MYNFAKWEGWYMSWEIIWTICNILTLNNVWKVNTYEKNKNKHYCTEIRHVEHIAIMICIVQDILKVVLPISSAVTTFV